MGIYKSKVVGLDQLARNITSKVQAFCYVGARPNLWLSQSQDSFVVGTVRAPRVSHFRCLATASNGAG
jgi:hypothetical protein